jgi:hypothetical protein
MYYALISSLPRLPYFEKAERLPITPLRLKQRLGPLRPEHAEQLKHAWPLVTWRPARLQGRTDVEFMHDAERLLQTSLDEALREYVSYRFEQQSLIAALRIKQDGQSLAAKTARWGIGSCVDAVRRRWDEPDFGLEHIHTWLPNARELLTSHDAIGLERLLMGITWRRLSQYAERDMFSFAAVFAYVFQWDILQAWLAHDAEAAKHRFRELIDKVTHVEHN